MTTEQQPHDAETSAGWAMRFSIRMIPELLMRTLVAGNSRSMRAANSLIAAGLATSSVKDFMPGFAAVT